MGQLRTHTFGYINAKSLWFMVALIISLMAISKVYAQEDPADSLFLPNLQVGISGGFSSFFGDLQQNRVLPVSENSYERRYAYGLNLNYSISPVFMVRFQGLYGELSGRDESANIGFESDYYEFNVHTTINFNNLFGEKKVHRLVNLFGTIGLGIMNYNTVVKRLDEYYVLKRVGYGYGTGYNGRQRQEFLMAGIGIDFRVHRRVSILLETVNKYTGTDLLDGYESGNYNDLYNYTSIGIAYRFAFLDKPKRLKRKSQTVQFHLTPIIPADISYNISPEPDLNPIKPPRKTPPKPIISDQTAQVQLLIEYRVQILAEFGKPLSIPWISRTYNVPVENINEDMANGYFIYTVGTYPNYSKAIKKRDELVTENGLKGAFVVAFKNGERIFPVK